LTPRTILSLIVVLSVGCSLSADDIPEYRLKSEFIERFTRFIDWPAASAHLRTPDSPFSVCVVGRDPFGTYLTDLAATKTIKGRTVVVRSLEAVQDTSDCAVLFISSSEQETLSAILARTASNPTLTIGDTTGFARQGVILNFYFEEDRLQFEINETEANASGFEIRAKLYKLARIVEPAGEKAPSAPRVLAEGLDTDYVPIATVQPEYPKSALSRGLEGWVVVEFDVSPAGLVENARVVSAKPRFVFNDSALRAVTRYRYAPRIVDGRPVTVEGVRQRITFKLVE